MVIDRTIVEQIVHEVMNKLERTSMGNSSEKPPLLVIHSGENPQVEALKRYWHVIKFSSSTEDIPKNVRFAAFINVSQDLIVKGALGFTDTPDSKLLSRLLMEGLHIFFIPSDELEWVLCNDQKEAPNPAYVNHLLRYKSVLADFGVSLLSLNECVPSSFDSIVNKASMNVRSIFDGKLLTENDVKNSQGDIVFIRKATIVTPLARDMARKLGKNIHVVDK